MREIREIHTTINPDYDTCVEITVRVTTDDKIFRDEVISQASDFAEDIREIHSALEAEETLDALYQAKDEIESEIEWAEHNSELDYRDLLSEPIGYTEDGTPVYFEGADENGKAKITFGDTPVEEGFANSEDDLDESESTDR